MKEDIHRQADGKNRCILCFHMFCFGFVFVGGGRGASFSDCLSVFGLMTSILAIAERERLRVTIGFGIVSLAKTELKSKLSVCRSVTSG